MKIYLIPVTGLIKPIHHQEAEFYQQSGFSWLEAIKRCLKLLFSCLYQNLNIREQHIAIWNIPIKMGCPP